MHPTTRIALITDIHHGPDLPTKRGSAALPLLERFAAFVRASAPDLVLELGDRISDEAPDLDRRRMAEVADALRALASPVASLCGNHDLVYLPAEENGALLGQPMRHRILDLPGLLLIVWQADARLAPNRGFALAEGDLAWLEATLAAADRPVLLATHVPLSGQAQTGNYYFERQPELARYDEQPAIRSALARCPVPLLCVAGHVHWNSLTLVDGIAHLTLQSLTETFTTAPAPAGAFALLELGGEASFRVEGNDPFACTLPFAGPRRRWLPPLGSTTDALGPDGAARVASGAVAAVQQVPAIAPGSS
ncbi:MAG: metallophosphoesterase [Geminicoccaceae bacterium]|nr:metallophosphoesterase [Geminicoccaceae bacterium]MCX8099872.1 metallophosphoesterase [Geminicoccaceae bacterium]